jgi:hypothetical protein
MNFSKINGYTLCPDLISSGDTVLFACNSIEDSLCQAKELASCNLMHVCPLLEEQELGNLVRIQRALTPGFEAKKLLFVSEKHCTTCEKYQFSGDYTKSSCATLPMTTVRLYANISLIILDLYGEEYKIAKFIDGPKQILIRFYEYHTSNSEAVTAKRIEALVKKKYGLVSRREEPDEGYIECLFVKD